MKMSLPRVLCALALSWSLAGLSTAWAEPNPDQVKKIEAAVPDAAPAKAAKPRKVLVYTRANGFVHGSIPIGAKAFEAMGKKTGAWEVTKVTDDPAVFDDLKDFDCIVLMSTTGEFLQMKNAGDKTKESVRKQNLLDYVTNGGGLVGIHAATDAYYEKWPEYGQLIGGFFKEHPYGKITVKIDDPKSPITAQFDGKDFDFSDEIYVFRMDNAYSRDRVRVLLSINTEKSNLNKQAREDKDYAVAWIRQYGKGRVFYTLLGHNDGTYMNPLAVKFMLAGTQYALGDLKADAAPSTSTSSKSEK